MTFLTKRATEKQSYCVFMKRSATPTIRVTTHYRLEKYSVSLFVRSFSCQLEIDCNGAYPILSSGRRI